jgi:dihydrolipoamide dehydrogenase
MKSDTTKVTSLFNEEDILTYQNVWSLQDAPESILIMNGDVIGIEFAQIFQAVGTQVTVIESEPNILPKEDVEISRRFRQLLLRKGIKILTEAQIKSTSVDDSSRRSVLVKLKSGEEQVHANKVFITDRVVAIRNLGLDKIGISHTNDQVRVNEHMETNIPGIYAVGDVTGTSWAHVAFAEGIVAAENAMGKKRVINYKVVPRCIFTSPEVASVGLTEKEAIDLNYDIKIGKFSMMANAGSLTLRDSIGLVKLVTDSHTGEILGAHILGPRATDLIAEIALAMSLEATIDEIITTIHAHPTLSEALWEAALDVDDAAIHK